MNLSSTAKATKAIAIGLWSGRRRRDAEAAFRRAMAAQAAGELAVSTANLREAHRFQPHEPRYHLHFALLCEKRGALNQAIESCRVALTLSEPASWKVRYACLLAAREPSPAADEAFRVAATDQSPSEVWRHILDVATAASHVAEYLTYCAQQVPPRSLEASLVDELVSRFASLDRGELVLKFLEPTKGGPVDAHACYRCADTHRTIGNDKIAVDYYARAVAASPLNATYRHHYANCLSDLGRQKEAVGHHIAATLLDTAEVAYQHALARSLAALSLDEAAVSIGRVALERSPDRADLSTLMGQIHSRRGSFDEASECFGSALDNARPATTEHYIDVVFSCIAAGKATEAALHLMALYQRHYAGVPIDVSCDGHPLIADPSQIVILFRPRALRVIFSDALHNGHPDGIRSIVVRFFETLEFFLFVASRCTVELEPKRLLVGDIGENNAFDMTYSAPDGASIKIPDHIFVRTNAYEIYKADVQARWVPWANRKALAYWRGTTTGQWQGDPIGPDGVPDLGLLPRLRLSQISRLYPDVVDARVSILVQITDQRIKDAVASEGLMSAFVDSTEFAGYKVQIDIDGNSNSWAGLFQKLLTGSPVVKVASPYSYRQWFYDRLVPWENFVPVRQDMSDLVDVVQRLLADPCKAEDIGNRGRELALSMTKEKEFALICDRILA